MTKRKAVIFILVLLLVLSSCAPETRNIPVDKRTPVPNNSQAVTDTATAQASYATSPTVLTTEPQDTETAAPDVKDDTDGNTDNESPEQQKLWDIVVDPKSCGYGPLTVPKPQISSADISTFNPDKISDYLITGLYKKINGYIEIEKASRISGKVYLSTEYDIYIDANDVYKYLKKTFSLSDKYILSFEIFEPDKCNLHSGKMYTGISWDHLNGDDEDEEGEDSDFDPNCIEIAEVELPQTPVADDAVITLIDYDSEDGPNAYQVTTDKLVDMLSDGTNYICDVWFKYSKGVITGIAEEYSE